MEGDDDVAGCIGGIRIILGVYNSRLVPVWQGIPGEGRPEFPQTVDVDLLRQGQPIDRNRVEALVAFLKLLTDQRYEPLLI